jgi:hypothetical protein
LLQGRERAGREALAEEIGEQFASARLRQQLIVAAGTRPRPARAAHIGRRW